MYYISTRGGSDKKTSARVIKQGLAEDGGLFVPESIPTVSKDLYTERPICAILKVLQ